MTTARPRRVYRPKSERTLSVAKAAIAAVRPRDARGHFLPIVVGVVRPAERKGRGEPKAGESVALSGPDAA